MVKVQATVLTYNNRMATLYIHHNTVCVQCTMLAYLRKNSILIIDSKHIHTMRLQDTQTVLVKQNVQLAIRERTILITAFLVYITPLMGLFMFGGLCQKFCHSEIIIVLTAFLGGALGVLLAKKIACTLTVLESFQPIIIC
ncbi:SoxR reducing system RseC family protein [Candidatus Erwinia haradaeae]|uniref:Protein RseC, partial n=1 Tax=Candidatus Erwinia haradaeae TaxID=1922217 RepID=A0A451DAQ4_9GAMM|nr:SoxR reducing system RseC family protein [Candidatus Erwinia haradaeae]VFP83374.1 Protein RseC [Candidatus Erwinia haradaeae]